MADLSESVKRAKHQIQDITGNLVLDTFDLQKCDQYSKWATTDDFVKSKVKETINHLSRAQVDHSADIDNAFNTYNEIVIYEHLQQKGSVKGIHASAESRPDYVYTTKSNHQVNLDLKTVSFSEGGVNIRETQKQMTRSKISIEEQRGAGETGTIFGEPVILSPFKKTGKNVHHSRKGIIETIRDRVESLNKPSQLNFENRKGILVIDTRLWEFPFFIQEALPAYSFPPSRNLISGALWHACFGKAGERTFEYTEWPYRPNIGKPLEKNGALVDLPKLPAVIFIAHISGQLKMIGFHRSRMEEESVLNALGELCDFINDDLNSYGFRLPLYPF